MSEGGGEDQQAQTQAERQAAALWADDRASQGLGIAVSGVAPGRATATMTVGPALVNGHGTCHGGYLFLLADTAFAFACNTRGRSVVAAGADVDFLAPVREGDLLVAEAVERVVRGRSGLYDVTVRRGTEVVLEFRGAAAPSRRQRSRAVQDLTPDLASLDPVERGSREELAALQLERMRWSLQHAYDRVPFHRRAFDAAGVHPGDLRELADLARFPLTTKADLREGYPWGMFAVPREQVARVHASSGTTGQPTVVGYTARDLSVWADLVARSLRAAGVRPGWVVHNAYGYGLFTGGLGLHAGAERLGCTVVPVSGGQTERQVRLLRDLQPDAVTVTPSYLLALLDELERQGVDPRSTSLQVGVLGAEPWTEDLRREVQERADLHAVDIYGLSEVMGPGVASECVDTKDGLHVWEDHFYPEVVDPDTGAVLPDGERGELVFTSLTREAVPVVRYRTRDLTRLLPGTARPMRRIERITGRSDDLIILRGVNVFPTQVEEVLLRVEGLAPHWQLVLSRPHRLDEMTVRVEARPGRSAQERARLGEQLCGLVKEALGITVSCDVVEPGTVERSQGKAVRVLDLRSATG